jgi:methionine synthase II (cobalamin-independent)
MPHRDREKVIDLILEEAPEIPVWPQLSGFFAEQMIFQYLEGLPGVQIKNGSVFLKTDTPEFDQELYAFYEEYLEVEAKSRDLVHSRFKMGPETGNTFFRFLDRMHRAAPPELRALKGQIAGPFTLLTGLKDQRDRALLYDDRLQDALPKHLAMKAKWQIHHLQSLGRPVIIFLDEPALAGYGSSAFISVSREQVQQLLKEVVDAVHEAGGLAGIHICANTDWLLAFDSGVDIINFDAYNYFEKFALYREAFFRFVNEGRTVAWGMVPTADPNSIRQETAQGLVERWLKDVEGLTTPDMPMEKILAQSLFTPSCGCGSLPEEAAERVLQLNREFGEIIKNQR